MTHTIIATTEHVDFSDSESMFVIQYAGELTDEAIRAEITAVAVLQYAIDAGDCTDQDAYIPDDEEIRIMHYVVIAGTHTAIEI